MPRDQHRSYRDQSQQGNGDRYECPSDPCHCASERSFAEGASLRRGQEGADKILIDPFLEYVRADGQSDDYQGEYRPVSQC